MDHGKNEFPTNESLKARRDIACPAGLPSKSGIYAARAEGAELWDVEGKRYIDFIGGIGVPEMIIILVIGVLLFGKRLPDVGRQVGKSLAEFKKGVQGVQSELNSAVNSNTYTPPAYDDSMEDYEEVSAPKFEPPEESGDR